MFVVDNLVQITKKYKGKNHATVIEGNLEWIAHKIYYDYQLNAFFFCKDISQYSTVCEMPEFLYTLSHFSNTTKKYRKCGRETGNHI